VDHQLLHCSALLDLWCFMLHSFGFVWVMPTIVDLLFDWWNWLCKHSLNVWNLISLCLMWTLWRARMGVHLRIWKAQPLNYVRLLLVICSTGQVFGVSHIGKALQIYGFFIPLYTIVPICFPCILSALYAFINSAFSQ
jgi:hypothetical protein